MRKNIYDLFVDTMDSITEVSSNGEAYFGKNFRFERLDEIYVYEKILNMAVVIKMFGQTEYRHLTLTGFDRNQLLQQLHDSLEGLFIVDASDGVPPIGNVDLLLMKNLELDHFMLERKSNGQVLVGPYDNGRLSIDDVLQIQI